MTTAKALRIMPPTTSTERVIADAELMLDRAKMRCYTMRNGIHIPGCIGCAVYDHRHCTCARTTLAEREWRGIVVKLVAALKTTPAKS